MNLLTDWKKIRIHFSKSFQSSLHVSIASVDSNNKPTVTPIGTLFLNTDPTGFYFEKFPKQLPKHAQENTAICILAVNSSKWFWLQSLFNNRFKETPAIKLYGTLGKLRKASALEQQRLDKRMKSTKLLKGNAYLWKEMPFVRDIIFTKAEKINIGKMTKHL